MQQLARKREAVRKALFFCVSLQPALQRVDCDFVHNAEVSIGARGTFRYVVRWGLERLACARIDVQDLRVRCSDALPLRLRRRARSRCLKYFAATLDSQPSGSRRRICTHFCGPHRAALVGTAGMQPRNEAGHSWQRRRWWSQCPCVGFGSSCGQRTGGGSSYRRATRRHPGPNGSRARGRWCRGGGGGQR